MKLASVVMLFSLIKFLAYSAVSLSLEIDPNGYIVYCPCMGRFGNQAEQFLGTFHFAKHLNRTLVLPPFVEYVQYKIKFIPFGNYIDVDKLREYHRVVPMDQFMSDIAPLVWNEADRSIACYSARNFDTTKPPVDGCNPFEGSPFKEFWHHVGVTDFGAGSLYYSPINTDYHFASDWTQRFGKQKVLAFVGAPSSFPTNSKAVQLQRYVNFSKKIIKKSNKYREKRSFARQPYMSVHIRHGSDWLRACDLLKSNTDMKQLFSSQQCLGDNSQGQIVEYELCMPSLEQVVLGIEHALAVYQSNEPIRHIHIATDFDNETMWLHLHRHLPEGMTLITPGVTVNPDYSFTRHSVSPHFMVDLHLMSHANVFIGNCISSFSAFVSRYRIFKLHFDQTTHFFAHHKPVKVVKHNHDEL